MRRAPQMALVDRIMGGLSAETGRMAGAAAPLAFVVLDPGKHSNQAIL